MCGRARLPADYSEIKIAFGLGDAPAREGAHLKDGGPSAAPNFPPSWNIAPIHNRMPVILARADWPAWLGETPADEAELKALLRPYPSQEMHLWPVDKRVGNVRNNDASLVERVEIAGLG